jgi:hypothetical protein
MKIVWIMASKKNHGGNRVIYEYGNRFSALSHESPILPHILLTLLGTLSLL